MLPLISLYHHPHIQPHPFQQGVQSALLVCFLLATAQGAYGFLITASFMAGHICISPSVASQVSLWQPRQLKPRMARLHQSGWHVSRKNEKALETKDGISNISLPEHQCQCKQMTEQHAKRSYTPLLLTAPQLLQYDGCFDRLGTNTFPTPSKRLL